jgi:hypothetical protein
MPYFMQTVLCNFCIKTWQILQSLTCRIAVPLTAGKAAQTQLTAIDHGRQGERGPALGIVSERRQGIGG